MIKASSWSAKALYLVMALLLVGLSLVLAVPKAQADFTNVGTTPDIGSFSPQNVKPGSNNTYTLTVTDATGFDHTAVWIVGTVNVPTLGSGLAAFVVTSPTVDGNSDGTFTIAGGGVDANGNYTVLTVNATGNATTPGADTTLTITFSGNAPATEGTYNFTVSMQDRGGASGGSDLAKVTVDGTAPSIPAANIVGTSIQAANDTIQITFSEPVAAADGTWSTNEFTSIASPDGTNLTLTNATFAYSANTLTITLNEATDSMWLTNGNVIAVTPDLNKIKDLAGNSLPITKVVGTTAISGDSIAPGIPVNQIVGTTVVADRDTIAITFSEKVVAADGTWSANEFSSIQSPDGTTIPLTNATFTPNANLILVTINLSDVVADAAWLTNGNVVAVTPAASKIKDLAGNFLPAVKVVGTTPITGDATAPTFSSAKFTTDTNLEITFGEKVKTVDASKLSSTSFTVVSATVDATQLKVNVTISGLSQTSQAGVSGAAGLQLAAGAVTDLAGNTSASASNQTIAADTTAPTISSATLNYGTGVLVITANEKIDATPATNVTLTNIHINNVTGTDLVTLGGDTVTAVDATTVTITLTEAHRAAAIVVSGMPGGDGAAVVLDVDGAVIDMNAQPNATDDANPVTETPDTVKPAVSTVTAATLHYGTGVLVITFVETIDGTPAGNVDASKIWISNTAGSHNVQLTGATVTAADATTVTIGLTAAQKAAAIVISGKPGGDGTAVVVDLDAGAVKDLAGNFNDLSNGNAVTETADTTAPTFVSANLTSSTNIDVTFNEGMGAVAASGSEFISSGATWTATAAAIDATDKTVVHVTVSGISATEELGITGGLNITRTALADLAGNAFSSVTARDIVDKIKPTFTIGYYTDVNMTVLFTGEYMNPAGTPYYIKITSSEDINGQPTVNIAAEGTFNDVTNGATNETATNTYRYTRGIVADAASLGNVAEVITITGTDNAANTATNGDVTGEKKIDAAVTTPTLSSPGNATGTSDNTPTLTWNAVTDNNGPVTYRLQVDNESAFNAPLVSDQTGLSATSYTLTTAVVDGTYYWRVTATDALGNTATSSVWSFVVTTDTTAPSVTVNYPNGGESLIGGSSATITWAATDNVTPTALLTIDLSYSSNGGSTWTSIATGQENDGAYTLTLPSISSSQVLVKVTATDAAGNSGSDTSNAVFSISVPSGPTTSISLAAGWNLVSLPLIPTSSAISTVLSGVSANVLSVWYYDANTAGWLSWNPTTGGALTTMVDGKGYWINMSAAGTLTVTGSELPAPPAVPPTYSVKAGWNLVGFKSTTAKTVGTYLTGTNYRFPIYGYTGGAYITLTLSSDSLQAGQGYWVYFNADGTISP